jgi:hypothetical protein
VSRGCGSRATHGDAQRAGECGGLVSVLGRGSDVVNNHGGLGESWRERMWEKWTGAGAGADCSVFVLCVARRRRRMI